MHILYLITKSEIGGAQRSVLTLADAFHNMGHTVTVGTGSFGYLTDALDKKQIKTKIFRYLRRTNSPITNLLFGTELFTYLKKNKVDVVHFNSSNTLFGLIPILLMKKKPRTIFTFRGLSFIDPSSTTDQRKKVLYEKFFKFFANRLDVPVFVCRANRDWAIRNGIAPERSVTIYNALSESELNFLSKEEAREKIFSKSDISPYAGSTILGTVGRLAYPKNQIFLVRALADRMKNDKNIFLILIGDGPDKEGIVEEIKKKRVEKQVILTGRINNGTELMKAFDIFLLPSIYEGLPLSVIECMHAETPVLASDVGGNSEILPESMIYPNDDTGGFLTKLDHILSKRVPPPLPSFLKHDVMINSYMEIYKEQKINPHS
jgi:glycosyltransferase involved in cell wall biosynthesis